MGLVGNKVKMGLVKREAGHRRIMAFVTNLEIRRMPFHTTASYNELQNSFQK